MVNTPVSWFSTLQKITKKYSCKPEEYTHNKLPTAFCHLFNAIMIRWTADQQNAHIISWNNSAQLIVVYFKDDTDISILQLLVSAEGWLLSSVSQMPSDLQMEEGITLVGLLLNQESREMWFHITLYLTWHDQIWIGCLIIFWCDHWLIIDIYAHKK